MTETEWLSATEPGPMLEFLRGKVSNQKLRLICEASCRRIWPLFLSGASHAVTEAMEKVLDRVATQTELQTARKVIEEHLDTQRGSMSEAECSATFAVSYLVEEDSFGSLIWATLGSLDLACNSFYWLAYEANPTDSGGSATAGDIAEEAERQIQAYLVCDIIGNPFRPVTFAPEWRTGAAVALAESMYQDRDFGAMPILADALQDAGCEHDDVLSHCRGPGPHVRGCWVVDLVTGQE